MSKVKTPQEKKRLAYDRDHVMLCDWPHAFRRNWRRKKAKAQRAARREARQLLDRTSDDTAVADVRRKVVRKRAVSWRDALRLKITKRQQMVGAHKARHEEKEAHVRSLRAAALASVEGAAAFAWAYWVLIAGSHRGPQRGDFNRELILALTRATRKLQGDQRRYVNWVLRCAAALQSQLQRSVRRRSDGNFSERPFLRPCVKH